MTQFADVILPADQTEGTESVVATWFKAAGDAVTENDPLLEISTDKVTVEIPAPATGVLREILKQEGDEIQPGEVLGRIEVGAEAGTAPAVAPSTAPAVPAGSAPAASPAGALDRSADLSPAVRSLIRKQGLDPEAIMGTGKGGRITAEDVEAHLAKSGGSAAAVPAGSSPGPSRLVPHNQMRRRIARHMSESVLAAPHVTSVFEADLGAVLAHREANKAGFQAQGARLTLTAYFVRAAVAAVKEVPETNASWRDDALEIWEPINIGVAAALDDGGLIVPVLQNAQQLDLLETARALDDLTTRARGGSLTPADVQGGTFTISNHGVSGSLVATPIIINQPQSAILGIGKMEDRAVVRDGAVAIRPMAYVTLTIDHRVLDGHSANRFLARWVETVEGWPPEA